MVVPETHHKACFVTRAQTRIYWPWGHHAHGAIALGDVQLTILYSITTSDATWVKLENTKGRVNPISIDMVIESNDSTRSHSNCNFVFALSYREMQATVLLVNAVRSGQVRSDSITSDHARSDDGSGNQDSDLHNKDGRSDKVVTV